MSSKFKQEVILIKQFNKQNQTKVNQAANTGWDISHFYLIFLFWNHTGRTESDLCRILFAYFQWLVAKFDSELSNQCYYSGNCQVLLIPDCHFTGNREVTEKEKQIRMIQEVEYTPHFISEKQAP